MKEKTIALYWEYSSEVDELFDLLGAKDPSALNKKPSDLGWSVIQVLHHLILAEENSIAYLRKKMSFHPELKRSGLGSSLRSLILNLTLGLPIKFKAPKSAASDRIPEQESLEETRRRWQNAVNDWMEFLEKMPSELADKAVYRHPRAGLLNLRQTILFLRGHFRRHRRQIFRTLA